MTTRVDFYLLPGRDDHARRLFACKLVEKAYRQGYRLYLRTEGEEDTARLDDLLWTFRQGGFVPHERLGAAEPEAPVLLGHEAPPPGSGELLVNLGVDVPEGYAGFARLAELVDQDEIRRAAARQRYRVYQAAGLELQTHTLERA